MKKIDDKIRIYRINDGSIDIIFFKIEPFSDYYYKGRIIQKTFKPQSGLNYYATRLHEAYLTFGRGYNGNHNGSLEIDWNINYSKCEIIKEDNILFKNIPYDVKSISYLLCFFRYSRYHNLLKSVRDKFSKFIESNNCSGEEKVLLFKDTKPDDKSQLIIIYKNKFIEFILSNCIFSDYPTSVKSPQFTPKNLKLKGYNLSQDHGNI